MVLSDTAKSSKTESITNSECELIMCGAYSLKTDFETLARHFNAAPPSFTYPARYNIRPTQAVPVIRNTKPGQIELVTWGIIPFWDKTGKKTIINARKD